MNKKYLILAIVFLLFVAFGAYANNSTENSTIIANVIADGIFKIEKCVPQKMAPGYTMVYSLHGDIVYWLKGRKVVRILDLPGKIHVMRQDKQGLYGLIDGDPMGFNPDGTLWFFVHKKKFKGNPNHDIIATSRGTFFIITTERVAPNIPKIAKKLAKIFGREAPLIQDQVIIEFDTKGKILWNWSVNEHLFGKKDAKQIFKIKRGPLCPLKGDITKYNTHCNALGIFENGDILLSVRNLCEIVRISYPDGKVIWRWGSDILTYQHCPTVQPDGSVLVYDNGTEQEKTGIVKFSPAGKVVLNKRLNFYSGALGSVEELSNGNWLLVDGEHGRVLEYTPDFSEVVFELKLIRKNYISWSKNESAQFYRTAHVEKLPF